MSRVKLFGWTAAAVSALWFGVHTFVGGPEVAATLPLAVRAPAWKVWNMVTGLLALLAVGFAWATVKTRRDAMLAAAVSAVLAVAGLLSAPLSSAGFALLPQGFLFVPNAILGLLAWWGMTHA